MYADFKLDESYTPKVVSVRVGNSLAELREVASLTLDEPTGWVFISLTQPVEGKPQCVAAGRTRAVRTKLTRRAAACARTCAASTSSWHCCATTRTGRTRTCGR